MSRNYNAHVKETGMLYQVRYFHGYSPPRCFLISAVQWNGHIGSDTTHVLTKDAVNAFHRDEAAIMRIIEKDLATESRHLDEMDEEALLASRTREGNHPTP